MRRVNVVLGAGNCARAYGGELNTTSVPAKEAGRDITKRAEEQTNTNGPVPKKAVGKNQ